MRRKAIIILMWVLCCLVYGSSYAQNNVEQSVVEKGRPPMGKVTLKQSVNENLIFLGVAIDSFNASYQFLPLEASENMNGVDVACKDVLRSTYNKISQTYLKGKVNHGKVKEALNDITQQLKTQAADETTVIIMLASHGEYEYDGQVYKYNFITTDTEVDDNGKAVRNMLSGDYLQKQFEEMANMGAKVLVFIDTCHAEALYGGNTYNGRVNYYAGCKANQKSPQIDNRNALTKELVKILTSQVSSVTSGNAIMMNAVVRYLAGAVEAQGGMTLCYKQKDNFMLMKYVERLSFNPKSLIPWKCSTDNHRTFDICMGGLEAASAVSLLTCGLIQSSCKVQINNKQAADGFGVENYRRAGKTASYGCIASAGVFVISYAARVCSVNRESYRSIKRLKPAYGNSTIETDVSLAMVSPEAIGLNVGIKF